MKELKSALDLAIKELGKDRISSVESLSKDLAIKLAVMELERLTDEPDYNLQQFRARAVVSNLLRCLGCEAVVGAWSELL